MRRIALLPLVLVVLMIIFTSWCLLSAFLITHFLSTAIGGVIAAMVVVLIVTSLTIGVEGRLPAKPEVGKEKKVEVKKQKVKEKVEEKPAPPEKEVKIEEGMVVCGGCGALISEKDTKCPHCGAEFEE